MGDLDAHEWKLWRDSMETRVQELEGGYKRQRDLLETNTSICARVEDRVKAIDEKTTVFTTFVSDGAAALKFVSAIVKSAKWIILYVAVPIAFIFAFFYMIFHGGEFPVWFRGLLGVAV